MQQNEMKLEFDSRSENVGLARITAAAFLMQLNPTLEEAEDVKAAISEAVTNAMIHGYGGEVHKIRMHCQIMDCKFQVTIEDEGRGIADISRAMEPMFTTKGECDRAGIGFTFMEAFMDTLNVDSEPGRGTRVTMTKYISEETHKAAVSVGESLEEKKEGR